MEQRYTGQMVISGIVNGQKFRPSNWPERMCEVGAIPDPIKGVMRYSPYLSLALSNENGYSVQVDFDGLAKTQPETYKYVCWFVESNKLALVPMLSTSHELVPA